MLWCIRQKLGTCAVLPKTTPDVTENGTVFLTFVFINLENEEPVKIEIV